MIKRKRYIVILGFIVSLFQFSIAAAEADIKSDTCKNGQVYNLETNACENL